MSKKGAGGVFGHATVLRSLICLLQSPNCTGEYQNVVKGKKKSKPKHYLGFINKNGVLVIVMVEDSHRAKNQTQ